jgi:hypothetical protein
MSGAFAARASAATQGAGALVADAQTAALIRPGLKEWAQ